MHSLEVIYYDILDKIDAIHDRDEISALLKQITEVYSLKTTAYFGINISKIAETEPYLAVTYSSEWIDHYKRQNYVLIDPVIASGFSSNLPIEWGSFDLRSARLRRFFGEASEFGLGQHGLTLPIRGRSGERALFTITSDVSHHEWQRMLRYYNRDFQMLGYYVHQMVLRAENVQQPVIKLSPRELECLKWTANGKTVSEVAIILGLSQKTVRFYHDLARVKLNATNITHAVSKAINLNLIFGSR